MSAGGGPPAGALVCVGELALDAEAEVLASLFEARGVPLLIQGRNHRRMLGVLGGGYVPMRLLSPASRADEARALLAEYRAARQSEAEIEAEAEAESEAESEAEAYTSPRLRLFTPTARHLGVAIFLSVFGVGLSSLYMGAWLATPLLALAQLAAARPDLAAPLLAPLHINLPAGAQAWALAIPVVDLALATAWLWARGRWGTPRGALL